MNGGYIMFNNRYVQSEEAYKGFVLKVIRFQLGKTAMYHRECELWKDGTRIAIGKTKTEMKDLIDHGCYS